VIVRGCRRNAATVAGIVALALAPAGCSDKPAQAAGFAPYLGAAAIAGSTTSGGRLRVTLDVNTGFPSSKDADAPSQHVFDSLRVAFAGRTVAARHVRAKTDLKSSGADGSYQDTSVWTDTWRAVLVARKLARGTYLMILTGCRHGTGCQRSVVPVCVAGTRILGGPGNVGDGSPNAAEFGRDRTWRTDYTCKKAAFAGVNAAFEPSGGRPPAQRLPANPAGRVK
jgi:hypothetical protein